MSKDYSRKSKNFTNDSGVHNSNSYRNNARGDSQDYRSSHNSGRWDPDNGPCMIGMSGITPGFVDAMTHGPGKRKKKKSNAEIML